MKNLILLIFAFFYSCSNEKANPEQFIQNSKNKNFDVLFNVAIEARNERNGVLHYYYSHTFINNDTINIPSFEYFDDFIKEKKEYYNKEIDKLAKSKNISKTLAYTYAKDYAQKLDNKYKELNVINSVSSSDSIIRFTINDRCNVYYLKSSKFINPYWSVFLKGLKKVDNNWYYECK